MFSLCDQAVIQYGVDPLIVGEYTPYELLLLSKQKAAREQKDFEKDLCLAWHTEAFARQKKLPSLEKILRDSRKKPKQRQNNKSDAILRAMAAEKGVKV